MTGLWRARGLAYRYPGSRVEAVREADLDLSEGEVVALVGPNGAGKTTLILLLLGHLIPLRGQVEFAGRPVAEWSAAGYLKAATGPFAFFFHALADPPWIGAIDVAMAVALCVVGLSLMLGLYTQAGCYGALGLLALFYVSAIPLSGVPEPHAEGAYLIVNKNLVEAGAVLVLLSFGTGRIAGLDKLREKRSAPETAPVEAAA